MKVKVAGTFRNAIPSVKVSNVYRPIANQWIKVAGAWCKYYQKEAPPTPVGIDKLLFFGFVGSVSGNGSTTYNLGTTTLTSSAYSSESPLLYTTSDDPNTLNIMVVTPSAPIPPSDITNFKIDVSVAGRSTITFSGGTILYPWDAKLGFNSISFNAPGIYSYLSTLVGLTVNVRIYI